MVTAETLTACLMADAQLVTRYDTLASQASQYLHLQRLVRTTIPGAARIGASKVM